MRELKRAKKRKRPPRMAISFKNLGDIRTFENLYACVYLRVYVYVRVGVCICVGVYVGSGCERVV